MPTFREGKAKVVSIEDLVMDPVSPNFGQKVVYSPIDEVMRFPITPDFDGLTEFYLNAKINFNTMQKPLIAGKITAANDALKKDLTIDEAYQRLSELEEFSKELMAPFKTVMDSVSKIVDSIQFDQADIDTRSNISRVKNWAVQSKTLTGFIAGKFSETIQAYKVKIKELEPVNSLEEDSKENETTFTFKKIKPKR